MTKLEEILPLLAKISQVDGNRVSLSELAKSDGRTSTHLQRVFAAEVGESPLRFGRRVALQRAAVTLLATEKSILQIALDAGFESHEGFSRAFRNLFEQSPREFRNRRQEIEEHLEKHIEIAHRVAPCVGLFRVSSKPIPKTPGENMTYEITQKSLEETPFLFIRREVKQAEIADALAEMLPAVFQYAMANGIAFAGPPTTRYPAYSPGLVTIDAGLPIAGPAEGHDEIQVGALCGGTVATTIHKGPYDGLADAHAALQSWAGENGAAGGAPWEVYITDPGEVPDPKDWLTEVILPLG